MGHNHPQSNFLIIQWNLLVSLLSFDSSVSIVVFLTSEFFYSKRIIIFCTSFPKIIIIKKMSFFLILKSFKRQFTILPLNSLI